MSHYLLKFKGTYRIRPELDETTHDIPRDAKGNIAEGYDDLYIDCRYGNKIYMYGHDVNKRAILTAYIPSIGRGRNIKKALNEANIHYDNYIETDEEVLFNFKSKDISVIADLLKAKTAGADISPFSIKNLPTNKNVEIPLEEIERYKEIVSAVKQNDLLLIHKITNEFLDSKVQKKYKKYDKNFDIRKDIRKNMLARQVKEYIFLKEMWEEYLKYLAIEIDKFYKGA